MTDETKAVEDFLGDLKDSGEADPLKPNTDDPFASIESEQKEELGEPEVKEEVEKPLPFHKDPKIQKFIEREIAKRIPEKTEETTQESIDRFEEFATKLFGNDTPENIAKSKEFKNILHNISEETYQKSLQYNESKRQEELAVEKEYENRIADTFEEIEEKYGIDLHAPQNKKLRVKFIDTWEKMSPKENGEISELADGVETFGMFQSMYKTQTSAPRAKELASKTMERSGGEVTQKDTGRVTWDTVGEKIRETLGM